MKKKLWILLIGTSVMLVSLQAKAQSSVTLYGVIDTGVEYYNNAAGGGSFAGVPTLTGEVPSRFGLKGTEDLGGGNKAFFVLENGFNPGTGNLNYGGRLFGRLSYVGLSDEYGKLIFGRQESMTFWSLSRADVIGPSIHSLGDFDPYVATPRTDNAIGYIGKFSNVTIGGTYSFGRSGTGPAGPTATNCPGQAGNFQACKQYTALFAYDAENFGVAGSYDLQRGGAGATAPLTNSAFTDQHDVIDGYVKFQNIKVAGGWLHDNVSAAAASSSYNLYFIGASALLTPQFALEAQAAKYIFSRVSNSTLLIVRPEYVISKRTKVYCSLAYMFNSAKGDIPVAGGGTVVPGKNQLGMMVGLQQTF